MSYPPWSLSCVEKKEKGSVPSRLPGWEPGAVKEEVALSKRECPLYFYREIRKNCESLFSLFLLVRAVRVVRGSCFSTGVSVVILTAKCAKTANKKGSVPSRLDALPGTICLFHAFVSKRRVR